MQIISSHLSPEISCHAMQIISSHLSPEISLFLRKGFSEITSPITGKALHAFTIKHYLPLSIFHSNTLIALYAKFGCMASACHLFDKMPQRNAATWNTIISGFVKLGSFNRAFELFQEMRHESEGLNGFVLASLISGCNQLTMGICEGFQIHGLVVKAGFLADVFVSSALLHFYGVYGFMLDLQWFFDEMPERNVVSWTSLMVGYAKNGSPEEALKAYRQMRWEGVGCNPNAFATLISSCGLLDDELLGLQVLGHVMLSGFEANVSVANALISMFGAFGSVGDACYIFDQMEDRDNISWNSMLSVLSQNGFCKYSLECFHQMRCGDMLPDSTTLSTLISACSRTEDLKWGRGVHGLAVKSGNDSMVSVCNTLVTMYSASSRFEDAGLVFQLMPKRDLISWNSMMACFVQSGQYGNALKLLAELLGMNQEVNHVTFATALAACSSPDTLVEAKIVHALIILSGFQENLLMGNALVTMYGKSHAMREAECVFRTMPESDVVTWNAMIGGYVENEQRWEAINAFNFMRGIGIRPNYITMINVLDACSSPDDLLKYGMPIHAHIVSSGFESDSYVKNSLLAMYAKCGEIDSSHFIFSGLSEKAVVSWNAMIAANAHHGRGEEALKLFIEMQRAGFEPDHFGLSGGLAASANLAVLEEGQQLHCLIIKLGFNLDIHATNALMDMYGKCGKMDDMLRIVPESSKRSRLSWNILISGLARHGCFKKAGEAFQEMLEMGIKPDFVTFVSLLSACNHAGLVDEGLSYFSMMTSEFGIFPGIEHCVCVVDLLGRSGRLADAERFIEEMPVSANDLIWRSFLSACRTHANLELGRQAAERLIEIDPSDDSAYVLLSNVCAINGRWDDVEKVRSHMELNNVKKKPACSWIKVKNRINSFGIGDRKHPQAKEIYAKLEELLQMIKKAGYVADTTFVLHDTDEEQKEHNLWNHSEKLALAFGLISTPNGSSIRIFKNLRVCGDCHTVYKFVSGAVGREIVLRDPYRFHHFSGGVCSCSDYW